MITKDQSTDKYAEVVTPIWWGLAAFHRRPPGPRRLRIRWFRLMGTITGLAGVCWLMIAVGLYFWFKFGRGFEDEKFQDVLTLPFHWPPFHTAEHDRKMGDYFKKMADWHLENKHLEEAFKDYRLAVLKTPDNLEARSRLADFTYVTDKNLDHYFTLLEEGLPYALAEDPKNYIDNYFVNLKQAPMADRSERIEKICRQYLGENLTNPRVRNIFALNLANVLIDEGQFDESDDIIKQYNLERTLDGVMLSSRLRWERGELHEAIAYIEGNLARFKNSDYLLGLLSRFCLDVGDLDKARNYILLRSMANRNNVMPRIELLNIYAKTHEDAKVDKEVNDIIAQFHNDPQAMTMLANFATNQGNVALTRRIYELVQDEDRQLRLAAKKSDFSVGTFALLVAQSYLTVHDYKNTLLFLDQIDKDKPDWLAPNLLVFQSIRAVADIGANNGTEAEMYVNKLIHAPNARPDTLLLIANRFIAHGAPALGQRLLAEAYHMDPHNQSILAQLVSVNLQLGYSENMDQNIHALMQTHRPPAELLYDAYRQLGSDHFIFIADREKLLADLGNYLYTAAKNRRMDDQGGKTTLSSAAAEKL
ncbi:MAG TPA: hypothetical protein VHH73_19455 [Verrucomicrobiae bacterium]|nr:hypothetical protein [Verrucomicrobiae bacterium]